jgi:hypothetical protein
MNMIRKQVYLTAEQDAVLKQQARERGVAEAVVLREALDRYLTAGTTYVQGERQPAGQVREVAVMTYEAKADEVTYAGADRFAGRGLDDEAWEEELRFIEALAQRKALGGSTRQWRREDAYDNRRTRLPG